MILNNKSSVVIYHNCHSLPIKHYLSKYFKNIEIINIVSYIRYNLKELKDFTNNHKELVKNSDLFISINLRSDRKFLNNLHLYCKNTCIKIFIPHYTSSIYDFSIFYPIIYNIKLKNRDYVNKITPDLIKKNNIIFNFEEINKYINNELNHFREIDEKYSDIKMFDIFKNNFKKHRLFMNRGEPSPIFFRLLIQQIFIYLDLNIENYKNIEDCKFAENCMIPIHSEIYNHLGFKFDNQLRFFDIKYNIYEYITIVNNLTLERHNNYIYLNGLNKHEFLNILNEIRK